MELNPLLSIAIPTYMRSEVLNQNLRAMLPELIEHQVAVYISDDSPDDATAKSIALLREDFPLLVYRKNEPRNGHDANFFATVTMPDTDYVWYLGDSVYFTPGTLARILEVLETFRPNFCFVNSTANDLDSRLVEGKAVHQFLLERTWYLTLTGATIYGREARNLTVPNERKSNWKNFPQLGLILYACSINAQRMYWIGEQGLGFNRNKSSYWLNSAFEVFVKDWCALISSFPELFNNTEQVHVIRSHAINTKLFSLVGLLRLRIKGALSMDIINEHREDLAIASPRGIILARLISRIPVKLMHLIMLLIKTKRKV